MAADEDDAFSFDLNSVKLEDIQLDASELAEFGILDDGQADLRELQALADANPRSAAVQGQFGMIRTQQDADTDYNVDNIVLSPEDLEDPELLRELGQLADGATDTIPAAPAPQQQQQPAIVDGEDLPLELKLECGDGRLLERYALEEKSNAVRLKQAGDVEGAREALRAYKALHARLTELAAGPPEDLAEAKSSSQPTRTNDELDLSELKRRAVQARKDGDMEAARELMTRIVQQEQALSPISAAAPKAASRVKTKQSMQQLTRQIEQCVESAKIHMKANGKTEASLFAARKKAMEADLAAMKAAYQGNTPTADGRTVSVALPVDLENVDVAEDELKVLISARFGENAAVGRKSKESLAVSSSSSDHHFKVALAWPPDSPQEKATPTFRPSLAPSLSERCTFSGIKRDMKGAKFFEHQKLRIDLYKKESSFLRTRTVLVGSAHVRLAPLMTQPSIETHAVELLDGTRRSVGLSVDVALKLRRPMSPRAASSKTVQWVVFDEFSSGRLFPAVPAGAAAPGASKEGDVDDVTAVGVEEEVDQIESYAVVEYEIERLSKQPAALTDPVLSVKLLALEGKRDAMDLRFEMGELSFDDYLALLRTSLERTKRLALEAKRAGNVDKARSHMAHVQIIENEIASASQ